MEPFLVSQAICDSFLSVPQACFDNRRQVMKETFNKGNVQIAESIEDKHFGLILVIIVMLSILILAICVIMVANHFVHRVRNEVGDQVSQVVGEYLKLQSSDKDDPRKQASEQVFSSKDLEEQVKKEIHDARIEQ